MSHLSRTELVRWRDEGLASDRERVVGHLAACDECGSAYAELIWTAPPASGPERLDEAAFRARGYATDGDGTRRWAPLARPAFLAPLGAAAAVLLAVILYPMLRPQTPLVAPPDEAVRATTIQALSPAGRVTAPFAFAWSSPLDATAYELVVYDARGIALWSVTVESPRVDGPPELLARLERGQEHAWQVTAINRRGERTIRSPQQRFVVQP